MNIKHGKVPIFWGLFSFYYYNNSMTIDDKLLQLKKSKFRSKIHLKEKDIEYIDEKGFSVIQRHATDFINKNMKVKLPNDGKQTPYHGHPVFIAQHATATCCRECFYKWYKVPKNATLGEKDINLIVKIIMKFIKNEYDENKNPHHIK